MLVHMLRTVSSFYLGHGLGDVNRNTRSIAQLRNDWAFVVRNAASWDCETDDYLNRFGL